MNLEISLKPGLPRLLLTALCGSLLAGLPAAAQISLVKTGFLNNTGNQTSYTLSFDAGNGGTADKLIVSAGVESAVAITGITYNGAPLTLIPNTGSPAAGRNRGIWYLDTPFSGGAADIVVSGDGVTAFTHMRLGVASISGSAPGAAIGNINGTNSVSLDLPVNGCFVFAAYAGNNTVVSNPVSPLVPIFAVGGDSANMAAGYEENVAAGTAVYSFSGVDSPQSCAAAFVPASAEPVIVSRNPAVNATNVPIGADLVATFSEPVVAGASGSIELWQVGGGSPVESFNVSPLSSQLTFSGQTLTINPSSNLTAGVEYYVLIPATAIVDTSGGDAFDGISDPTAWSFTTDGTAPTLVSRSPADDQTGVLLSVNLVATFNEPVLAGTGEIELRQSGGSLVESFIVDSSLRLTFSGATLTIDPTADLAADTGYYVTIPATAVKDLSGNFFTGLAGTEAWNFSTSSLSAGQIWDGGGTDANWLTAANWDTDATPNFANPIFFQGNTRTGPLNNRPAGSTVGGISFANDGGTGKTSLFTLNGTSASVSNSMTLGGDITTTASSSAITDLIHRSLDVILNANRTITTDANHNLRIDGQISETGGSWSITKEGAGQLVFGNNSLTTNQNSFSGGININNGVVSLVGATGVVNAAGSGTIHLGATSGSNDVELRLAGSGMNPTNTLVVQTGSSGTKTLANRTTNSVIYKGIITANDNLTILAANTGGRLTVDAAGCTIAEGKTVSFSNTGTAGAAMTESALWGGDGAISYTSSTQMGFSVSGAKTYTGGATLGAMSGTGVLVVTTSSTGPANAPTDGPFGTDILTLGATKMRGGNVTPITIGNPILFSDNPTFTTTTDEKSLIFTGDVSLGATRTLTVEIGSTVNTEALEFSGEISGSGFGITKEGAGTLRLSGNNTYTGATLVSAGTLSLAGGSQASPITVNASASLGFTLGSTTTSSSSVALGGTVKISGTPTLASYTLMTATGGFTGTPILDVAIPNYVIVVDGTALKLNSTITDPYLLWSGGAAFDADSNNDGVKNGLAWLLGAPNKDANALGLLPKVNQSGGGLIMKFTCLKLAGRGTATLSLQHSGDLGLTDPWFSVAVPDVATTVGNVVFTVPTTNADPNLVDLEATIPVTEALNGKLFGRVNVSQP
jgi:autotransporter-associated beta strand protein